MYYGVLLLLVSLGVMIYASDARARWDIALVAGIGLGLIADEIGLLILKLSYWNIISVSIFAGGGLVLYLATALKSWKAFFFQAEVGIRDLTVTGVQTCALPI